ncbi:MAG: HlyD family efflux transporter periplasmic adaptor subunit [Leptospiraceae bacterium]|nr:HlyD family efflux transporter periplasmic adaptor subunit [Leptospiraceae bacterium]
MARAVAKYVLLLCITIVLCLIFLPWQQTSEGSGRVVAYAPLERQQGIESPVTGRVTHWHVVEGQKVKKGDMIVGIADNDPEFLSRLGQERDAVINRLSAAEMRANSIQSRILAVESSVQNSMLAAENRARMAGDRVRGAEQALDGANAKVRTADLNIKRQKQLFEKGLTSERNVELAQLEIESAIAERDRASATLDAAKREQKALNAELQKVKYDGRASLDDARASLASARSEVAKAREELPKIESRVSRQRSQEIYSPRDGTVMRILKPDGQQIAQGEILAVIVPASEERAVELFISGNDIPLIIEGKKVRLQFQGWPALQISGWPEIAIATFGGFVQLVDVTDNGTGSFRVLIAPDPEEDPWPPARYLRQGVRARGWIFLNRVSLGFELWRKFNDFPPMIPMEEPTLRQEFEQGGGLFKKKDKGTDKNKGAEK